MFNSCFHIIRFGFILMVFALSSETAWAALTKTEISQLYVAIFGRASEGGGNRYWQSLNYDMAATAGFMLDTDAAKNYFGNSLDTHQAFIEHIYLNTLNKTLSDDPGGIAYWVSQLEQGNSRAYVAATLVGVIKDYAPDGPYYNPNDTATVAAYNQFTNRVTVSDYMENHVQNVPSDWPVSTSFSIGLRVTDSTETVSAAENYILGMAETDANWVSSGTIIPGSVDTYTFTATAGDHVEIRMVESNPNSPDSALYPRIELYGPSGGNALSASSDSDASAIAYTVSQNGTYTILAKDTYAAGSGEYYLYFAKIPGADKLGSLSNNDFTSGTIIPGSLDTYTFTATAGDHVEIRMVESNPNSPDSALYPRIELYGPSGGNALSASSDSDASAIAYTVSQNGTYTILAKDYYASGSGEYYLYFAKIPGADKLGSLSNNDFTSGTIVPGSLDTYTFTATAGDHVEIRMVESNPNSPDSALYPRIELYGPSGGNALSASSDSDASAIAYTVSQNGTYTILAKDYYASGSGEYYLYFAKIPGADKYGLLSNNDFRSGTIIPGSLDTYTFTATAGDHVEIRMVESNPNSPDSALYPRIELYGPSGGNALSASSDSDASAIAYTVSQNGTYTILAKDYYASGSGEYNLSFSLTH